MKCGPDHARTPLSKEPLASAITKRREPSRPIQSASSPSSRGSFSYGVSRSPKQTLRLVQRNENMYVFVRREVGSGHVAAEQARIGNARVASDTGTVLAPSEFLARRDHGLKKVGPGSREGKRGGCEGLARGGSSELGQRNGVPLSGCMGIWGGASA